MSKLLTVAFGVVILTGCANGPTDLTDADYIWEDHKTKMTAQEMWRHMRREFRGCRYEVGFLDCIESEDLKHFECDAAERNPDVAYGRFYINQGAQVTTVSLGLSTKVPLKQQGRLEVFRAIVSGKTDVCEDS